MVRTPVIVTAPHRLLFLIGVFQFTATMVWWSEWLLTLLGIGQGLPQVIPSNLLHAPIMLFLVVPPLFFGFLLTVFPRWTGFPDSPPVVYLPVALAFLASVFLLWLGLTGILPVGILSAFVFAAAGWFWALGCLARLALLERRAGRRPTWHAWSILAAIAIGLACLLLAIMGLWRLDPLIVHVANLLGLDLFIVPVFITVCHRMIPFFAGNVVAGYVHWRPFWVLGAFWAASIAGTAGFALALPPIAAAGKFTLALLTGLMLWKWWPRASAPGLLWVLMLGFAWAPAGFAIAAWTELFRPEYGRAAIHALTVGFAISLVIAMVTRVTQGHSGRPLLMPAVAWTAFVAVQIATALRLLAAMSYEQPALLTAAALILSAGFAPWAIRGMWIYVRPRVDGKPG